MTRRADDGKRGRLLVAPRSLAEALSSAAIYVGAAGTTAVQAACVGIPAVVTAAVPNQVAQAAALERAQAVRALTRTQVAR
jgi:spore coat polysaccharide biosynthesis predicted glycosyltransferase SpsG